ncbi:unnamed protein product [Mytilus edulis]|uniref:Uncharacterized protein n=1 Tax=Mytilus edulis TaxID=6550 RepID=A0A8S3SUL5_MYTED|nr:unnamed protein product [Mytilus edulis]
MFTLLVGPNIIFELLIKQNCKSNRICKDKPFKRNGKTPLVHEKLNLFSEVCANGYRSDNGEACRPCLQGFYGRKCGEVCVCEKFQECNHILGCSNMSDAVNAATRLYDLGTPDPFIVSSIQPNKSDDDSKICDLVKLPQIDQTINSKGDQLPNEISNDDESDIDDSNDETDEALGDGYLNPYKTLDMLESSDENHRYSKIEAIEDGKSPDSEKCNTADEKYCHCPKPTYPMKTIRWKHQNISVCMSLTYALWMYTVQCPCMKLSLMYNLLNLMQMVRQAN